MKKKLTAIITAVAMMTTLVPAAAFATEAAPSAITTNNQAAAETDITINVWNFNNSPDRPEVGIQVDGNDIRPGDKLLAFVGENNLQVLDVELSPYRINEFYFKKSLVPNINDPYANNKLTLTILRNLNTVVYSKTVEQSYTSSNAEKVLFTLLDGNGTKNRKVNVKFDGGYFPAEKDYVVIEGLNAAGNPVGSKSYINIGREDICTDLDADGMRSLKRPITFTLNDAATSVRLSFESNNEVAKAFTTVLDLTSRYGTLKALELSFDNNEIYRGETVTGKLVYVNTAGQRYDVTKEATYKYVDRSGVCTDTKTTLPQFTVKDNAKLGSTVVVEATYGSYTAELSKPLTVCEKIAANNVKLDTLSAKAGKSQLVTFTLTDRLGKDTVLGFKPDRVSARFVDASDKSASFKFTATNMSALTSKGTMSALLECDKPCSGKIELTFTNSKGNKYRVLSDVFTFTDPNAIDKRTVTLTIGSANMLVNGTNKTLEAAPLIYKDRTFVPLRAVGEALGAQFKWDAATSTITFLYEDTTLIMKPGSTAYTVNGVQKHMEVAPYIIAGVDRTMIPVRFVGEGLGFNFEVKYRPDKTTEKVIIKNYK